MMMAIFFFAFRGAVVFGSILYAVSHLDRLSSIVVFLSEIQVNFYVYVCSLFYIGRSVGFFSAQVDF